MRFCNILGLPTELSKGYKKFFTISADSNKNAKREHRHFKPKKQIIEEKLKESVKQVREDLVTNLKNFNNP